MADPLITFSADVNLGQIGVIASIVGGMITFYVKSKLDLQRLNFQFAEAEKDISLIQTQHKIEIADIKREVALIKDGQQEIKVQLAANTALMSMQTMLKKVPDDISEALKDYLEARSKNRTTQQMQQQPFQSGAIR